MANRYFSAEQIKGSTALLTGSEAHHLLHVMRASPGTEIILFDGRGGEFPAEVVTCGRAEVELTVGQRREAERELPFELTLAAALPKGDRQRWLVEKAVELGVRRLMPLNSQRSEPGRYEAAAKLARYVIEASKQCGRNRLTEITPPTAWATLLGETAERRLVAHPEGRPLQELELGEQGSTIVAVGPEGGLTEHEVAQAAEAGWEVVTLGERILRAETAALALTARIVMA